MSATPPTSDQHTMLDPDEANRWLTDDRRPLIGEIAQVDAVGIVNPNLAIVRGVAIVPGQVLDLHYIEVESLAGERRLLHPGAVGRDWDDKPASGNTYAENLQAQRESAGAALKQARRNNLAHPTAISRHTLQTVEIRIRALDELIAALPSNKRT